MTLVAWRHPKPRVAVGICIGRAEVAIDPRRAKRLAHRVRAWARRARAERVVHTSDLLRAMAVGRWLRRWGWRHRIDERLTELDFGDWTGRAWSDIGAPALDAWCAAFRDHPPGHGEAVGDLLVRCGSFMAEHASGAAPCIVVGHAGWISAAQWLAAHGERAPVAAEWPPAVAYAARVELSGMPLAANQSQSRATAQRSH